MNDNNTILVIASSVDSFILKDGREEHIGYYLNELVVPVQAALDAGYQMVLATPNGNKPVMDPASAVAAHFGGSEVALRKALDFINTHPAMQNPRSFHSVIEEGLDKYVGFYAPGGAPADGRPDAGPGSWRDTSSCPFHGKDDGASLSRTNYNSGRDAKG